MQRFSTVRLIVLRPLADLSKVSANPTIKLGAVHKVRHAIFGQFLPLPPVTLRHTSRDPPKVRHTSRTPPIFRRPIRKHPDKSPLCKFCLNCSRGVFVRGVLSGGLLSERFCLGWFLSVPVLSEYMCICHIRKLNITLNFM